MAVSYTEAGTGPSVVLLHGGAADRSLWQPTVQLLGQTHRVIAIDYGGCGNSPYARAEAQLDDYLQEVRNVLQELNLTAPTVFLGHSVGGMIALTYSHRYQEEVKGLLLVGVTARMDPWVRLTLQKELDIIRAHGPRIWKRAGHLLTRRNYVALHTNPETLQALKHILATWDFRKELPAICVPVHLASGRFDLISTPRQLRYLVHRLPDATMTVLPGGHSCMDSRSLEFNRWLLEKLQDIERRLR